MIGVQWEGGARAVPPQRHGRVCPGHLVPQCKAVPF